MSIRTITIVGAWLLVCTALTGPAHAGRHEAVSAPVIVDAREPDIVIVAPVGDEVVYGFDEALFTWTVAESHPSADDLDRSALIRVNDQPLVAAGFPANEGRHDWLWTATDLSSGNCVLEVTVRDVFGNTTVASSNPFTILLAGTGVPGGVPTRSHLVGARPNPFNPSTSLVFGLAASGRTVLTIHDVRGRAVRTLLDQTMPAGSWQAEWNGRDDLGRTLPGGTYLARLVHGGRPVMTRKVVLLP